jgi:molybdate transport system substrate-binding protein
MTAITFISATTAFSMALGLAQAAEVRVASSGAIKEAYVELVANFERATGHEVLTTWGGTESVTKRVRDGEVFDLVIVSAPNVDRLVGEGKLIAGSRVDVAKSGVGVAVRDGLPKPDVSSGDAVKKAVLDAKSVAYSSGPSGFYLVDLFKKMGITDQIKHKVKQTPSGVQVGDLLARGEADLGFQQVSELVHVKDIQYLGPLPADIQHTTTFSVGLHAKAPEPDAAMALVKALTASEAAPVIRRTGMEPG